MVKVSKMDKYHLALKTAFASEYAFFIKAQNFHWNVEGMFFEQFQLNAYAPASFRRFSMLSEIDDETEILEAQSMCATLLADSEKMQEIFKITYQMAEENRDFGLANFLAERQDAHAKHSWMLRATLK
jgi:starvation-inducible DNA-binding protein